MCGPYRAGWWHHRIDLNVRTSRPGRAGAGFVRKTKDETCLTRKPRLTRGLSRRVCSGSHFALLARASSRHNRLPLTTHYSPLTTHHSHHSQLTTHSPQYSPLVTPHSPLATRHSPLTTLNTLTTYRSPHVIPSTLTTHHSPLTAHRSPLDFRCIVEGLQSTPYQLGCRMARAPGLQYLAMLWQNRPWQPFGEASVLRPICLTCSLVPR